MSNTENQPDSIPEASGEVDEKLEQQIDTLLDNVDTLTNEVLSNTENKSVSAETIQPPMPPQATAVDDIGLSQQSPLIQDGEPTSIDEVIDQVDNELDTMEKLISDMNGGKSDPPKPITLTEKTPETEPNLPEADETPSALDIADEISRNLEADEAESISSESTEAALDHDLEKLVAGQSADKPTTTTLPTEIKPPAQGNALVDLSSISIRRILLARLRKKAGMGLLLMENGLIGFLSIVDAPFKFLSPAKRELIGYCALGTLAMSLLALLLTLF